MGNTTRRAHCPLASLDRAAQKVRNATETQNDAAEQPDAPDALTPPSHPKIQSTRSSARRAFPWTHHTLRHKTKPRANLTEQKSFPASF